MTIAPDWIPIGSGLPFTVNYRGAYAAGTAYNPGDVIVYNGVNYLAMQASTGQTPPGVYLPQATLSLATTMDASGTNIDLAWPGSIAVNTLVAMNPSGGSIRTIGTPTNGAGSRISFVNTGFSTVTFLHQGSGAGKLLFLRTGTNFILGINESIEFVYDGGLWTEVARDRPRTTYGTTPPASPNDGDIWTLPADTTNGIMWQFRYNAGSASAYKWEFIGGGDLISQNGSAEATTAAGSWVDLTTVGPRIIVPRAGDYDVVSASASGEHTVVGGAMYIGIAKNAGTPYVSSQINVPAANSWTAFSTMLFAVTALVAGDDLRLRYYMASAGTGTWSNRIIRVHPWRVS